MRLHHTQDGDAEVHLGYETTPDTPIDGTRRFGVSDPFGNRIEFLAWLLG